MQYDKCCFHQRMFYIKDPVASNTYDKLFHAGLERIIKGICLKNIPKYRYVPNI